MKTRKRTTFLYHTISGKKVRVASNNIESNQKVITPIIAYIATIAKPFKALKISTLESIIPAKHLQTTPKGSRTVESAYVCMCANGCTCIEWCATDKREKADFLGARLRYYARYGAIVKIRAGKVYDITQENIEEELNRIHAFVPKKKERKLHYLACDPEKEAAYKFLNSQKKVEENMFVAGQKERVNKKMNKRGYSRNVSAHCSQNRMYMPLPCI